MQTNLENRRLFEESSIPEAVCRLALPVVIGQVISVIYNMADTFFVGLTGSDAMVTAVTVCMPAFMLLSAIANLFGAGGASVIARALGARDGARARAASVFAFWGCAAVSAAYAVLIALLPERAAALLGGGDPAVLGYARDYLLVTVAIGGVPTAMAALMAHLVRSEGKSLQAGVGVALGGIVNVALDPLMMFVLLPKGSEALGAAIATAISNLISMLYYAVLMFRGRKHSCLAVRLSGARVSRDIVRDVLCTGAPACLMTLCENISFAVLDRVVSAYGLAAQAGVGVAKKVNMLAHCVVRGMSQGVLPLIGYNYASGNLRRMRRAVLVATSLSVLVAALCTAVSLCFSKPLVGIFIHSATESATIGARDLRILCLGAPFSACAYMFISFFQATGHGGRSLTLALLRKGVVDIPLMLILNRARTMYAAVWATPIADVLCCAVAIVMFVMFSTHLPCPADEVSG